MDANDSHQLCDKLVHLCTSCPVICKASIGILAFWAPRRRSEVGDAKAQGRPRLSARLPPTRGGASPGPLLAFVLQPSCLQLCLLALNSQHTGLWAGADETRRLHGLQNCLLHKDSVSPGIEEFNIHPCLQGADCVVGKICK